MKCLECGSEMEAGFVVDKSYSANLFPRWIKADLAKVQSNRSPVLKMSLKECECRLVESFRCSQCGLLKSYATRPADPPSWFRL